MRTLLICHENERLNRLVLPRWLASFSHLAGVVSLKEKPGRRWRRWRREIKRVGLPRFLDVAAFRLYYRLMLAARDEDWETAALGRLCKIYPDLPPDTPILYTPSPNLPEARAFIQQAAPDLIIARCKVLLNEAVFSIPRFGTCVMHPGICPEYRNAHGCFWALANRDLDRVGMSLLRIDKGVDTGPIYAYFRCEYDERRESHIVIQLRTVFDNLDAIQHKLEEIGSGAAQPIDVSGRDSATWGQPWLTRYIHWKHHARR